MQFRGDAPWPLPPLNFSVTSPFIIGALDLRWEPPAHLSQNCKWEILGVNVYRSHDSEFGPYTRLNTTPVGASFYRDETTNDDVVDEDVTGQFIYKGTGPKGVDVLTSGDAAGRWMFRVQNFPIVKPGTQALIADNSRDVTVKINGQEVVVAKVFGQTGEIELISAPVFDANTQKPVPPLLPTSPADVVTCSYSYNTSIVKSELRHRMWYRITTIGRDPATGDLFETPLDQATEGTPLAIENLDYIWREATRRNRWILYQGGERVKVFIHKEAGELCPNHSPTAQQPLNDCPICFGTRYVGGYEGPFELIIAPDDAERAIRQTPQGRRQEHTYEVWTGPSPMLSQRDFIVKQNNDRYSIGPVRMPTNRGNILQQHFQIGYLDEKEIRYQVGVPGGPDIFPQTRTERNDQAETMPQITEKSTIPDEHEERGRTVTYENIMY
jgi:hypothetical protein